MDQLRGIFHRAIFGRAGYHSSPPTAGFIEFLEIMSSFGGSTQSGHPICCSWGCEHYQIVPVAYVHADAHAPMHKRHMHMCGF